MSRGSRFSHFLRKLRIVLEMLHFNQHEFDD